MSHDTERGSAREALRDRIADTLMEVATDDAYYRTQSPRGAALFAADRILALIQPALAAARAEGRREGMEGWDEMRDTVLHETGLLEINYVLGIIDYFGPLATPTPETDDE